MRPPRDKAALAEDAEWLAGVGVDDREAAPRLGYRTTDSLRRALRRAGVVYLADQLRANRPLLNEDTWVTGPISAKDAYPSRRGTA